MWVNELTHALLTDYTRLLVQVVKALRPAEQDQTTLRYITWQY